MMQGKVAKKFAQGGRLSRSELEEIIRKAVKKEFSKRDIKSHKK